VTIPLGLGDKEDKSIVLHDWETFLKHFKIEKK
jgi:hypothetical protein